VICLHLSCAGNIVSSVDNRSCCKPLAMHENAKIRHNFIFVVDQDDRWLLHKHYSGDTNITRLDAELHWFYSSLSIKSVDLF
jgi:hypothetical protein